MAGFGSSPLGTGPYGVGTPATSSANAGLPLADDFGASQGSKYINPRTRSYERDANGRTKGMPNVPHLVQLALLTTRGSSAMTTLGDEAPGGVIGANFVSRRQASIRQSLTRLVDDNMIEIVAIEVYADNRPVFTLVRWRDLTTTLEHEARI